jgi:hypothetical protein
MVEKNKERKRRAEEIDKMIQERKENQEKEDKDA